MEVTAAEERRTRAEAQAKERAGAEGGAPRGADGGEFSAASAQKITARAREELGRAAEGELAALNRRVAEVFDGFVESRLKACVLEEARHGHSSCVVSFADLHLDARPTRIGAAYVSELGQFHAALERYLAAHGFALTRMDHADSAFTVAWCGE